MVVQPGLCPTWSETPKTGFLTSWLNFVWRGCIYSFEGIVYTLVVVCMIIMHQSFVSSAPAHAYREWGMENGDNAHSLLCYKPVRACQELGQPPFTVIMVTSPYKSNHNFTPNILKNRGNLGLVFKS